MFLRGSIDCRGAASIFSLSSVSASPGSWTGLRSPSSARLGRRCRAADASSVERKSGRRGVLLRHRRGIGGIDFRLGDRPVRTTAGLLCNARGVSCRRSLKRLCLGFPELCIVQDADRDGHRRRIFCGDSAIDELIPAKYRGRIDLIVNGSFWVGRCRRRYGHTPLLLNQDLLAVNVGWRLGFGIGGVLGLSILMLRAFRAGEPAMAGDALPQRGGRKDRSRH